MTVHLETLWFVLVGILFTGYAILDGFDFGVGMLHLVAKTEEERRLMMNAIGPVWDGNEVWLVTAGGALFAVFPDVYATVFSGFYLGVVAFLAALIFRAVAIEFRGKLVAPAWRAFWDVSFCLSSFLASFLLGLVMGNLVRGIPLGPGKEYLGSFSALFNPYAILMGVTVSALFVMHGSIYAVIKTEGELHKRILRWTNRLVILFTVCAVSDILMTIFYVPHITQRIKSHPMILLAVFFSTAAIVSVARQARLGRDVQAFLSSCTAIITLTAFIGLGMFPNLVYSAPHPEYSLTIQNAASSTKTLSTMLVITSIGMPLVLAYTAVVYWIFRGKVKLDKSSY